MSTAAMIFQCTACRALVAAGGIVVDGARAGLPCPTCGVLNWLPTIGTLSIAAPTETLSPPASLPSVVVSPLPVVSAPLFELPTAALAVPTALSESPTAMTPGFSSDVVDLVATRVVAPANDGQAQLATRFTELLSGQWHNDAGHKQLLKAAAASQELAFVGGRYRAVLDVVRDEPRARAAQQELITLAMATMQPTTTTTTTSGGAIAAKVVLAMVVIGVMLGGGIAAARWVNATMAPLTSSE